MDAVIIAIALIQFLYLYIINVFKPDNEKINQNLRIKFGSSLAIALELLLAADILATAIALNGMILENLLPSQLYEQP